MNYETGENYDKFYEEKEQPSSGGEGVIQAVESDGKGVPMIKKEAAELKARQGKGEWRLKKKAAMSGISLYSVDRKVP
ncbi:hypothetical protein QUF90_09890 [Desulfococcaceae bacterium HSG9]|nr:hypothetical protein [Desulfococcaceae bacterium HSG9]